MPPLKKDFIETVFCIILQISMLSGSSNYLYDCKQHKLVFSIKGYVYCAILHISIIILSAHIIPHMFFEDSSLSGRLAPWLLHKIVLVSSYTSIGLNLVSHWTGRAQAPKLIHKMNQIRLKDFFKIQNCPKVERKIWAMAFLKTALIAVFAFNTCLATKRLSKDNIRVIYISFVTITVILEQFQFFMGMIFACFLFKLTNWRLSEIVEDINRKQKISRKRSKALCFQLTRLGRIHTQLRQLTLKFKDLFQVGMLSNLLSYFLAVVFMFFFSLIVSRSLTSNLSPIDRITAIGNLIACNIDLLLTFYICRELPRSCNASADIVKEISSIRVMDRELEENIEVLCYQLKREKMHLTICGMFNLDEAWFKMAKAALLHCLLMIQIDYDNI